MIVVDSSALLAFVLGEPGADLVEEHIEQGAVCSAANWSEVAQKVHAAERDWPLVRSLLLSYDLTIDDVTVEDAESAARLWSARTNLSLADRLCLALVARHGTTVLTADGAWGTEHPVVQIR
jgi:PIN domain nuclease of toxin-antitoxin system